MEKERQSLQLDVETYALDNGLTVLLQPDDSVPIVAVNLWYHVGSKDESADRTGLAHLFEHLMFEGSANYDAEYFKPLQEAGGSVNGSTSHDRTNYYEVVPSNFLELALWLEADRMGRLLPVLTQAKLDNQRSVVENERRQRVENQPYGMVAEEIAKALYPADHPYSWPVIGYMDHLEATTLDDVHDFFRRFYQPGNASLTLCGSFNKDQAKRWIERYFAPIPKGPAIGPGPRLAPRPKTPKRLDLEDAVALPRLDMVFATGPRFSHDEPAIDFLAALLAGHSKDSRLKRRLVREEKLLTAVGGFHHTMRLAGQFVLRMYGLPNADMNRVEQIVLEEVERLRQSPPDEEELRRVRNYYLNDAYSQVETVLGKANTLNHYLFYQGRATSVSIAEELARYEDVTAEQIRKAADRYLQTPAITATVLPSGQGRKSAFAVQEKREAAAVDGKHLATHAQLPSGGPTPDFALPAIERATLSCGMKVVLVQSRKLPRIDVQLIHAGGSAQERETEFGLARLTAETLDEATKRRNGLELAQWLDVLGARMGVYSGVETGTVSFRCLSANADEALSLFSETVLEPLFDEADIARERSRVAAELAHREKQPTALADDAIDAAVFGELHPYGRPADGTAASIAGLYSDDLRRFHQRTVRPEQTSLAAVGDVTMSELIEMLERRFGRWESPDDGETNPVSVPIPRRRVCRLIERPGSAQSVVRIGGLASERTSPDYFPMLLLNAVLGGQFASRLNLNLREEKGYTYGARSAFYLRRRGGSFIAGSDVQGDATIDAVQEMIREILGPAGDKPITDEELRYAKAYLRRRFPARFETASGVAAHLAQLAVFKLPDDYYDNYLDAVGSVTLDQIREVAQKHLIPENLHVVVVGDPDQCAGLEEAVAQATAGR